MNQNKDKDNKDPIISRLYDTHSNKDTEFESMQQKKDVKVSTRSIKDQADLETKSITNDKDECIFMIKGNSSGTQSNHKRAWALKQNIKIKEAKTDRINGRNARDINTSF